MSDTEDEKSYDESAETARAVVEALEHMLRHDIPDSVFADPVPLDPVDKIPMAERLDITQLIAAYRAINLEKSEVDKKNELLNRNLLKHFRMKKVFRAYNPENPDLVPELFKKYREALDRLDEMMASRRKLTSDCTKKIADIEEAQRNIAMEKDENVMLQKKEIRDIGMRLRSSQTGHFLPPDEVEKLIARMDSVRERISQVRLVFIETIDKHTEIDQKAKSLEDLGNGLRMIDFEQLRAERQSLSDKIEERNNELAKLRLRCNADTQILAHVREKESMLDNVIAMKSLELERCTTEMNAARNDVNKLKTERDDLRKAFNSLSQACGLLDKPDLLVDYDTVHVAIGERNSEIEMLRKNIEETKAKTKMAMSQLKKLGSNAKFREEDESPSASSPHLPWIRNGVPIKRLQNKAKKH